MMELFDIGIFLGVLFAMLFSSQPKRSAMAVCVLVSLAGLISGASVQYFSVPDLIYPIQSINEVSGALLLIALSRRLKKKKDRTFFYLMSGFLMTSCSLNSIYIPIYINVEAMEFWPYLLAFKSVAVVHVITMLWFADGITNSVRNIRNNLLRGRVASPGA